MKKITITIALLISGFAGFSQTTPEDKADTTIFKVGNNTAILINRTYDNLKYKYDFGKGDSCSSKNKDSKVLFVVDVGVNGYLDDNQSLSLPSGYKLMDVKYSRSRAFGFSFMTDAFSIVKNRVYLSPGLGITWNSYHFENNINIASSSDSTVFGLDTINSNSKYKLRATFLEVPLVIGMRLGNLKKPLGIQLGVIGGFKIGSIIKQKYQIGSAEGKARKEDDFNLNPIKLDFIARLTFDNIGFYCRYSATTLFKENKTLDVYPFSAGITIGNFGGN